MPVLIDMADDYRLAPSLAPRYYYFVARLSRRRDALSLNGTRSLSPE